MVQWDQRGAGKTFIENPDAREAPLDLHTMASDGVELALSPDAALRPVTTRPAHNATTFTSRPSRPRASESAKASDHALAGP